MLSRVSHFIWSRGGVAIVAMRDLPKLQFLSKIRAVFRT
jgi:hypothetical protein